MDVRPGAAAGTADQADLLAMFHLIAAFDKNFAEVGVAGADAVAVATAAMMAVGCQQYRICDTDKCPLGIATQDPALRARLDVERSATRVANYFKVATEELGEFARLTGHDNVHDLAITDLCTTNSEISTHTDIEHV